MESARVLVLEPYHGGSHRSFVESWAARSRHRSTVLGLPAHHWKWRMRQGPLAFAPELTERHERGERWDLLFCSDMLDLATLRGLVPPALRDLPAIAYFHENQLTYPVRSSGERDLHFALTNLTTTLAADEVWFNSDYHRRSFLDALPELLGRMPDPPTLLREGGHGRGAVERIVDRVAERSRVEWPGIEDTAPTSVDDRIDHEVPLHLLWVARWEYDKNPEAFFETLRRLREREVPFRLSVLGQSFRRVPAAFERAKRELADAIESWGYRDSREEYEAVLRRADVVVSTARHEFFGLAVAEAVRAGAWPLLPNRLSYPELLSALDPAIRDRCLFDGSVSQLVERLAELAERRGRGEPLPRHELRRAMGRYLWTERAAALDAGVARVLGAGDRR